jgi:hypothetical protein
MKGFKQEGLSAAAAAAVCDISATASETHTAALFLYDGDEGIRR